MPDGNRYSFINCFLLLPPLINKININSIEYEVKCIKGKIYKNRHDSSNSTSIDL